MEDEKNGGHDEEKENKKPLGDSKQKSALGQLRVTYSPPPPFLSPTKAWHKNRKNLQV
jgi:hypothetical protein